MDYEQTLDYLYHALPMYHRVGASAYKADIGHTVALMEHLGHPEQQFRSVHVAGTNGKGSVSHLLASVLQQCGYRVGLYTSPHLVDFRERIRIDGIMIERDEVSRFVAQHHAVFETLELSFFEMTVGMAFDHFARHHVDIAVIEVGMGGRLDSTNVITPLLSVITNIGLDHTQFLGTTLEQIAVEKAGIIKPGVPVVVGETQAETAPVFRAEAARKGAPLMFADQRYRFVASDARADASDTLRGVLMRDGISWISGIESPLSGSYQTKNLATLAAVVAQLEPVMKEKMGGIFRPISTEGIRTGIARVVSDTGLHGRWEVIGRQPLTVCETAHNADGIAAMLQKLQQMHYGRLHLIYGCVNDKDYAKILQMLPAEAERYYTQPSVPRRLAVEELSRQASAMGLGGKSYDNVHEAIRAARHAAADEDLVLVTGSIFLVADALTPEV